MICIIVKISNSVKLITTHLTNKSETHNQKENFSNIYHKCFHERGMEIIIAV